MVETQNALSNPHGVGFIESQDLIRRQCNLLGWIAQLRAVQLNAPLFDQATCFRARLRNRAGGERFNDYCDDIAGLSWQNWKNCSSSMSMAGRV